MTIVLGAEQLDALASGPRDRRVLRTGLLDPWLFPFDYDPSGGPLMPTEPGSAVIVFEGRGSSALRRGFALPVQWVERADSARAPGLPRAVLEVAERVERIVREVAAAVNPPLEVPRFVLRLHPTVGARALDGVFPVSAESAALPLAIALWFRLVYPSFTLGRSLLATGGLDERGRVHGVTGYEQKLELADRLLQPDTLGKRYFVCPEVDEQAATAHARRRDIELVPIDVRGVAGVGFDRAMVRLAAAPRPEADLETQLHYANLPLVVRDVPFRSEFYRERLVEGLAASRLRRQIDTDGKLADVREVDRMLVPVSEKADVALLSVLSFRPTVACALLVSTRVRRAADEVEQRSGKFLRCRFERIEVDVDDHDLDATHLDRPLAFLSAGGRCVVDITPGTRELMALGMLAAFRTGTAVVYVKTKFRLGQPEFGTERIVRIPAP
jgi:hypothetical protein